MLKITFCHDMIVSQTFECYSLSHLAKLQAENFEHSGGPLAIWTDENMERVSCHP